MSRTVPANPPTPASSPPGPDPAIAVGTPGRPLARKAVQE
ncbi:hypothetical protein BKA25_002886 [Actinoalloteichus hymeniacidonis]|uniref:Uncharacterized protein n=1 Tax=Actinoalloteichus hymeniacidonis TaxID=340345 RepID=A0AAC9MYE9_9PSEU|nr:hypothetical protein TL08_12875 [Actinoalloteichus hymeniacidonis]MBB5908570.1 hypothetical protein [Actinoalloteichus hymeniacidonis]